MPKLHLGCGAVRLDGFINIDIRETSATDRIMDISNLAEFSENSIDTVYASYVLDHFSFRNSPDVLREWNRVLRKGGELILRVPDFDILVNNYLKHRYSDIPQELNLKTGKMATLAELGRYILSGKKENNIKESLPVRIAKVFRWLFSFERRALNTGILGEFLGGQDYSENYHKAFFNEKYLRGLLYRAGFAEVKRVGFEYFPVNNDSSKHPATMCFSCLK